MLPPTRGEKINLEIKKKSYISKMENKPTKAGEAQGAVEATKKAERKVQLSIDVLKELATNENLLTVFVKMVNDEPELKTPMLIAMARREVKQLKLM